MGSCSTRSSFARGSSGHKASPSCIPYSSPCSTRYGGPALRLRRRANYEALHAALAPHNALDCPAGADAMIYPFLCRVDGLRGRLIKNKVYVSQWWKYLLELLPADSVEADYSRYLLPLPIDQRYTPDDMRALAALVLQLKEEGEPA